MTKSIKLTVSCDADLRDAFVQAAARQDSTASQLVRSYMRAYVAETGQTRLPFDDPTAKPASTRSRKARSARK